MLLLTATTDTLELDTDSAATVDVHASWMDYNGTTVTPGRTNTAIASATTTTILAAPASSTQRALKTLHVRNRHASLAVTVTLVYDQNGTEFELHKVILNANDALEYVEGIGFFTIAANKLDIKVRVTADVINATTSFADVTGLSAPVVAGRHYCFNAHLYHIENASTTGARFGLGGVTMTGMRVQQVGVFAGSLTAATMQGTLADVTAVDTAAVVATSSAGTPQVAIAILSGWFNPSADGTVAIRCQSEVAVAAGLTVKIGSWANFWEVA